MEAEVMLNILKTLVGVNILLVLTLIGTVAWFWGEKSKFEAKLKKHDEQIKRINERSHRALGNANVAKRIAQRYYGKD